MNIITEPFINDIGLAICIFPADTLHNQELIDKMTEYTTFYALRFAQLSNDRSPPVEVFHAMNIESGLHDLADQYEHILFMASGVRIYDMSIIFDVKRIIQENHNYLAAAHILEWQEKWYELHHQFVLVNTKKWIAAGSPDYGGWEERIDNLPVVERSFENFHDHYTPLWIKFTGQYADQFHQKQGWNFINQAARNGFEIINWNQEIRNKRTYYYPEDNSERFLQGLKTIDIDPKANANQRNLINQLKVIGKQIWVLNSENMDLELMGLTYDTIALPAAGFKFLHAIETQSLNKDGKLIIYDYNPLSIDWIKFIYENKDKNIDDLIKTFEHRQHFKFFKNNVFGKEGLYTKEFSDSLKITKEFFGGSQKFEGLLELFRNTRVEFLQVDLLKDPNSLTERFQGNTVVNISNIFCTDFSNAVIGMKATTVMLKTFLNSIKTQTLILGQDSYCRPMRKLITIAPK